MNWYLFTSIALIVFLCGIHARFAQMFKEMGDAGLDVGAVSSPILRASGALMPLVNLNLLVFLILFGINRGWGMALLTVLGGAAAAYAYSFVLIKTGFYNEQISTWHKASWLALPILSVGIWLILYGILPLGWGAA